MSTDSRQCLGDGSHTVMGTALATTEHNRALAILGRRRGKRRKPQQQCQRDGNETTHWSSPCCVLMDPGMVRSDPPFAVCSRDKGCANRCCGKRFRGGTTLADTAGVGSYARKVKAGGPRFWRERSREMRRLDSV